MRKSIAFALAAGSLFVSAPLDSWGQGGGSGGTSSLEQVLVESANTPAEHQALANFFRGKAEQQRSSAADHRWMAKHYAGSLKGPAVLQQKAHCEKLASLYEQTASEYDEMAKAHEQAAKAQ